MTITYRQMQKEDIAKVTPLFIEYWNGTGDEWTPELVYSIPQPGSNSNDRDSERSLTNG